MQDKLCFKLMLTLGKVNLQRRLCRIFGSQIIIIIIIIMIIYIYISIWEKNPNFSTNLTCIK
jgi:hypothetical protein